MYAVVLSPWIVPINTSPKAFYFPLSFWHSLLSLLCHSTGQDKKLNASAEKHTSGNDPAAPAARVMNPANCAYHRLPLLVLIAVVTTCLERRWALLPGAQPQTGDSHLWSLHVS